MKTDAIQIERPRTDSKLFTHTRCRQAVDTSGW